MLRFGQNQPASIHVDAGEAGLPGSGSSGITGIAQPWLESAGEFLEDVVTNRPALALGTALAAGVFLGWLIKRR